MRFEALRLVQLDERPGNRILLESFNRRYIETMGRSNSVQAFAALASEVRLAVYQLLLQQGADGMVAGAIASALDIRPNGLSFHLKELTRAGLITVEQEGRFLRYRADPSRATELIGCLVGDNATGLTRDSPLLPESSGGPSDPQA